MGRRYEVVQWATGVVGSAALRSVVRHPKLDLVGEKVYDDAKADRDAGQDERLAQGLSTTGFHRVDAVPLVCDAPDPGIKTCLDLPMITGCMGTHETPR